MDEPRASSLEEVHIGPYDHPAEKIATEARKRFVAHMASPPATDEMLSYADFVAMVAYEMGRNYKLSSSRTE